MAQRLARELGIPFLLHRYDKTIPQIDHVLIEHPKASLAENLPTLLAKWYLSGVRSRE